MKKYILLIVASVLLQGCSEDVSDSTPAQLDSHAKQVVQGVVKEPNRLVKENVTSYQFDEFSVEELERSLSIESGRIYAYIEFNAPSVVLNLPKSENSEFAEISFQHASMVNEKGEEVKHEVIRGLYDSQYFSKAIRFSDPQNREKPLSFNKVTGQVSITYPISLSVEKLTGKTNSQRGVSVEIDQNMVIVKGDLSVLAGGAGFFLSRSPVSVFNAKGELLKPKDGSTPWAFNGEIKLPFDQEPKEVHLAFVEKTHQIILPYELEPSELLPESTKGRRPK